MKLSNRTWILLGLVLATAVSAMLQYATQGILATGHSSSFFPTEFWIVEGVLWAFRALVEACVVAFLFSTKAKTTSQNVTLGVLEVALIVLIAATLGPTFAATGYGLTMKETLPVEWYWIWNFGIGSYPSLMIGSAAFAWKIHGEGDTAKTPAKKASNLSEQIVDLLQKFGELRPGELASRTGSKPWQVSRTIKELIGEGVVEKPNGTVRLMEKA